MQFIANAVKVALFLDNRPGITNVKFTRSNQIEWVEGVVAVSIYCKERVRYLNVRNK